MWRSKRQDKLSPLQCQTHLLKSGGSMLRSAVVVLLVAHRGPFTVALSEIAVGSCSTSAVANCCVVHLLRQAGVAHCRSDRTVLTGVSGSLT